MRHDNLMSIWYDIHTIAVKGMTSQLCCYSNKRVRTWLHGAFERVQLDREIGLDTREFQVNAKSNDVI